MAVQHQNMKVTIILLPCISFFLSLFTFGAEILQTKCIFHTSTTSMMESTVLLVLSDHDKGEAMRSFSFQNQGISQHSYRYFDVCIFNALLHLLAIIGIIPPQSNLTSVCLQLLSPNRSSKTSTTITTDS